jgi:prevent-host-death family protein
MLMGITTFSSREFNQDASRAKKATGKGPVFITDRGRPAHVLLSIEDYRRLLGEATSLLDALAQKGGGGDFDFTPPMLDGPLSRPADLS